MLNYLKLTSSVENYSTSRSKSAQTSALGRTDNRNQEFWRKRVQKEARNLTLRLLVRSFLIAVRSFWMQEIATKKWSRIIIFFRDNT
ncbi:hypothetical protein NC653_026633 [Populus alba x Populus x berolinensis]|uniref:Uncharacterized protein n=1 Tax=Populus alba x Populus x berolinensis TaxID=444605 RepID=A0AAD6Q969_9ROSI|nr:hypothetical protein NC653_026633 [Populus alba x Populus x berolinensis]